MDQSTLTHDRNAQDARPQRPRGRLLTVTDDIQKDWRCTAKKTIARFETRPTVRPAAQSLLSRLLRRRAEMAIHVPAEISLRNGVIEVLLDTYTLTTGVNHIVLPKLEISKGTLVATDDISVFGFNAKHDGVRLKMHHKEGFDKALLPGQTGYRVFISTARTPKS